MASRNDHRISLRHVLDHDGELVDVGGDECGECEDPLRVGELRELDMLFLPDESPSKFDGGSDQFSCDQILVMQ